jgi:Tfp pilus assembly protein PilV
LLIEVMVSALLVALIAVATLSGFDVANRVSADERHHNQAALLAAQSQEQLRTDPASTLDALQAGHSYTQTIGGTKYTIAQKATLIPASEPSAACNANESTKQTGSYVQIASSVTWPQLLAVKRPPVTQTSVITPPTGSALEVDVTNGAEPVGVVVPGVTAHVTYTAVGAPSPTTLEGTTSAFGCFVLGGIPATSAKVEVTEKPGLVTKSGTLQWPTKQVTIAPNITTHYHVTLAEGGALEAQFAYQGSTKYAPESNTKPGTKLSPENVTGDTFVAYNKEMNAEPNFEVGSTVPKFSSAGAFEVIPGTYNSTATTPKLEAKYPNGNLFPFPSPGAWTAYAGDCVANDAETVSAKAVKDASVVLGASETAKVTVPMAYLGLNVYKGTKASEGFEEATSYKVTTTNTGCAKIKPNNATEFNEPKREQETTTSTTNPEHGGHLKNPFQPLGPIRVCLAWNNTAKTEFRTYTVAYTLKSEEEYVANIFLKDTGTKYTYEYERLPAKTKETVEVLVKTNTSTTNKCS